MNLTNNEKYDMIAIQKGGDRMDDIDVSEEEFIEYLKNLTPEKFDKLAKEVEKEIFGKEL